jgi:hypothetical protein
VEDVEVAVEDVVEVAVEDVVEDVVVADVVVDVEVDEYLRCLLNLKLPSFVGNFRLNRKSFIN